MTRHTAMAAMVVEQAKARALRRHAEAIKAPSVAIGLREVALAEQISQSATSETVRALVEEPACDDCCQQWDRCVCPDEPELGCSLCVQQISYSQCTCETDVAEPDSVDFSTCNWRWK